jgi:glutamate dehydrogenase
MRVIAAFNHRHIFIDPTPDAKKSFAERQRLFALPRSGWNDYNTSLISKGGGVFERSAKSIKLTAEMRSALGVDAAQLTPDELIRMILKAPVDLLWNGGIGTYVKAAEESHEQVGDRTNAGVRVNGAELRCKIVGEGGNLGFTQRGRIEFARAGGRINTDAIDNSGGVDCSDHEVNIKIGLSAAVASGRLTLKKRDALLKSMTDEVSRLVLVDNRLQTQAITIAESQGVGLLDAAEQLMQTLEASGLLNRAVEFLPDSKQIGERRAAKQGLTRPEIAVLLAYAKMALFNELQQSAELDAPYFEQDLLRYFPKAMQKEYGEEIRAHRLRREIVATMITNSLVNRTGFAFAHGLMRATGLPAIAIAKAYIATRDAFGLRQLWSEIEALDGTVAASLQAKLFGRLNLFIEHNCRWFLQYAPQPMAMDEVIAAYSEGIRAVEANAESLMNETLRKAYQEGVVSMTEQGVPKPLAERLGKLEVLASAGDMIDIARESKLSVQEVGAVYSDLSASLKFGWLRHAAMRLQVENYWQQLAAKSLVQELFSAQRRLTQSIISRCAKKKGNAAELWAAQVADDRERYLHFIGELRAQQSLDYAMLIVAMRQVQWISGK